MSNQTTNRYFKLAWYQSWIMRVAMVCMVVLIFGFLINLYLSIKVFDSVSKISSPQLLEAGMDLQLEEYKNLRSYYKNIIVKQISYELKNSRPKTKDELLELLKKINIGGIYNTNNISIVDALNPIDNVDWLDSEKLSILSFTVLLGPMQIRKKYENLLNEKRRRQIIALKLDHEIRPSLIWSHSIVIFLCLCLIGMIFFLSARRYKFKIDQLIRGLLTWIDDGEQFRFNEDWPGELGLITSSFNHMADEIDKNKQRRQYLEKMASWQTIARKLAHEIKNPLTPIKMMINQLHRSYDQSSPKFTKLLNTSYEIINSEIESLTSMVDSFSKFSRLPSPEFSLTNIESLCHQVLDLYRSTYTQHTFRLNSNIDHKTVEMDPKLFSQVLKNLIKNASEASEKGVEIVINLTKANERCIVEVSDSGPGIPVDLQSSVFEAYFTTKHTGETHGMGLGLAICRKIILDHDGKVSVKSKPGRTVFTIELPYSQGIKNA